MNPCVGGLVAPGGLYGPHTKTKKGCGAQIRPPSPVRLLWSLVFPTIGGCHPQTPPLPVDRGAKLGPFFFPPPNPPTFWVLGGPPPKNPFYKSLPPKGFADLGFNTQMLVFFVELVGGVSPHPPPPPPPHFFFGGGGPMSQFFNLGGVCCTQLWGSWGWVGPFPPPSFQGHVFFLVVVCFFVGKHNPFFFFSQIWLWFSICRPHTHKPVVFY